MLNIESDSKRREIIGFFQNVFIVFTDKILVKRFLNLQPLTLETNM